MTTAEALMQDLMARLLSTSPAPILPSLSQVRRFHRTPVTREQAPAIRLVEGRDAVFKTHGGPTCDNERELIVTVIIYTREEDNDQADALKAEVHRRLDPVAAPYPRGARITPGPITPEQELGDLDANRIEMEYRFKYNTTGWSLE